MVVCQFYLKGMCRFGTNCRNEHVNNSYSSYKTPENSTELVRTEVANEASSVLSGKQWILSCCAPFKDKPSLPDFIEDLSPEEVRWNCYEAKKLGTITQFTQDFNTRVAEAAQKMRMLQNPGPVMLRFLVNLYNSQISKPDDQFYSNNTNSVFGNTNSTSVFGQTPTNNIFVKPQASLFGNPTMNTNSFGNNAFTANTNSFGSSPVLAPSTNLFGGSSFNTPPSNNVFGSVNSNASTNIFAKAASTFGQPTAATGPFSSFQPQQNPINSFSFVNSSPPTASVFGGNSNNTPLFGHTPTVGATNIFTSANTFQSQPSNNIFGSAQTSSSQTFGTLTPETKSIFGQPTTQSTESVSVFNQNNEQSSIFQQNSPTNIFGMNQSIQQSNNVFGQTASTPAPGNVFQVNNTNQNAFGANPFLTNQNSSVFCATQQDELNNNNVYSKMEDLTAEEIAAYQTDDFKLGLVPLHPPTADMCM